MAEDPGHPSEVRLFCKFGYEIMATVTQACCVERINKRHGMVHSKARASMGSATTIDCLYIFTMECLLHKQTAKPAMLGSFETFVAALDLPADDLEDVMQNMNDLNIADFLPAESSDAHPVRRQGTMMMAMMMAQTSKVTTMTNPMSKTMIAATRRRKTKATFTFVIQMSPMASSPW